MADWAKRALNEVKQAKQGEIQDAQTRASEQRQIMAEGPRRWDDLTTIFRHEIAEFNKERNNFLRMQTVLPDDTDTVTYQLVSPKCTVEVAYYASVPKISYRVFEPRGPSMPENVWREGEWSFVFDREQTFWLKDLEENKTYCVSQAAEYLLDRLI